MDHRDIDRRSLELARAVVSRLDPDPEPGLARARSNLQRWGDSPINREWADILRRPWPEIRAILLDPGEDATRLRQSSPFAGVLSPQERWEILREYREAHGV